MKKPNWIYKALTFLKGVASEGDGTPSSKRVTAMWVIVLVSAIVGAMLYMCFAAGKGWFKLDTNVMTLLEFIGGSVLIALLSFASVLFGINGWQGVAAMKFNRPIEQQSPTPALQSEPTSEETENQTANQ